MASYMVYKLEDLFMTFNPFTNYLTLTKAADFLTLSRTALEFLVRLSQNGSVYDRVVVNQNAATLEIQKLFGNFLLSFDSTKFHVKIPLSHEEINDIASQYPRIEERIEAKGLDCDDPIKGNPVPDRFRRGTAKSLPKKQKLDTVNIET